MSSSSVAVVEAAPRRLLTSALRYRDAMPEPSIDDEALERLISRCTSIAQGWCDRVFARETVIETFRMTAPKALVLSRTPVVSLDLVSVEGQALAPAGYHLLDSAAGVVRLGRSARQDEELWHDLGFPALYDTPRHARLSVHAATYAGGWILPDDPLGRDADLPEEVEHACHLLVRAELDLRRRGAIGLASERLGDATRTYASPDKNMGMELAKPILARYRRVVL